MDLEPSVPVVAALLGGLLTVVGGFLGQFFLQKRQQTSVKLQRIADSIEQIGRLANKICKSGHHQKNSVINIFLSVAKKDEDEPIIQIPESEEDEFLLLIRLYRPQLHLSATEFTEAQGAIGKLYIEELPKVAEAPDLNQRQDMLKNVYSEAIRLAAIMDAKYNKFMDDLSNSFEAFRIDKIT